MDIFILHQVEDPKILVHLCLSKRSSYNNLLLDDKFKGHRHNKFCHFISHNFDGILF